jgi:ABC-type antimicrobial peptide transport system permease subunit
MQCMDLRSVGYALTAGLAVALVVGVAATELVSAAIEFSVFVGIPTGVLAGVAAAAFVAFNLGKPGRRDQALALARFGVATLATLLVAVAVGLPNSTALPVAVVAGVVAAAATLLS